MNDEQAEALGRRYLATHGHEEPERAVIVLGGVRVVLGGVRDERGCLWRRSPDGLWPDFRDDATLGCLLAEVRERLGDPHIRTRWSQSKNRWQVMRHGERNPTNHVGLGITEAEALVCALKELT